MPSLTSHEASVSQESSERPLVSVLLPVFNAAPYLERSLRSIVDQTYDNIEVIVIDDGSTDSSSGIIEEFSQKHSNIIYFKKSNSGVVDSLNEAVRLARGEFLARQDADDISFPNRISQQVAFLQRNPGIVAVGCRYYTINEKNEFIGGASQNAHRRFSDYARHPAHEPYLPHPFLMLRGDELRALKYRHVYLAEDADLYWRLDRLGQLWNVDELLGAYRVHQSSVSGNLENGRRQAVFSQLAAVSAARRDFGITDLTFPREWISETRKLQSFDDLLTYFKPILQAHEFDYLTTASACKLLEFSQYRPYKLEPDDLKSICYYVQHLKSRDRSSYKVNYKLLRKAYKKKYGILGVILYELGRRHIRLA